MLRLSVGREGIGRKTEKDRGTARGGRNREDGERERDRENTED